MTGPRTLLLGSLLLAGCVDRDPMTAQPRYDVYEENPFFADARAMRPSVPGAVSQEAHRRALPGGIRPDGSDWLDRVPVPLTRELLELGRQHFEVTCATCHGLLADGESVVARKMTVRPPPSLIAPHSHALTTAPTWLETRTAPTGSLPHPPGFYFTVITSGFGLMPSYADMLGPRERWAVVAYLQALALSQGASLAAAPPEIQQRLLGEAP